MRCLIAIVLAALVLGVLAWTKIMVGSWPTTLFYTGLAATVFMPIYDLITDGQMKHAILLTPLTLLVAAAAARFLGV